jgi:hypothetical protein
VIEVFYELKVVIHGFKMKFPLTIAVVPLKIDGKFKNHLNPVPTAPEHQKLMSNFN